jgi:hypothetical protein
MEKTPWENIRPSQIVKEMLGDERRLAEDSVVVMGYLHKGQDGEKEPGKWLRLYRTLALDEYIEFRYGDIYWIKQLDKDKDGGDDDRNPLGVTIVWLHRDAIVRRTQPEPAVEQEDFLSGDITSTYLPRVPVPRRPRGPLWPRDFVEGDTVGCTQYLGCPKIG